MTQNDLLAAVELFNRTSMSLPERLWVQGFVGRLEALIAPATPTAAAVTVTVTETSPPAEEAPAPETESEV